MNFVAIDTSGKNLTLVICIDGQKYIYFNENCGVNHSTTVVSELEKLAEKVGFDFNSADFFAVTIGAGSFTGIRIGVSVAKALALSYEKPILSITSFDTIAYNDISGKRLAVIDAKHGSYYVCGYDDDKVVLEPSFVTEQRVKELSSEFYLMSFERLDKFDSKIVSVVDGFIKAIEHKQNKASVPESVTPLYIRKSQAEEGR